MRTQLIRSIMVTAGMMLSMGVVNAYAAPIAIKVSVSGTSDFVYSKAMREVFKPIVEKETGGKYRVDIYDNLKFGNYEVCLQGVQHGMLHICQEAASNFSTLLPELGVLDLPFLVKHPSQFNQLIDGPAVSKLLQGFNKYGIECIARNHLGPRSIFSRKKVTTLEDFKHFKMRSSASQIEIKTLQAEGMNPTPVPWTETYSALQQGIVDGTNGDLMQSAEMQFDTVAPTIFQVGHAMICHLFLANKEWWDNLGADKPIFEKATAEMQNYIRANIDQYYADAVKTMQARGTSYIEPSDEEISKWQEATKDVYKDFTDTIPEELVMALRAEAANIK